ncbi:MAG: 1-acyl-sn-glycerol-3-phosphate acyltransferase [Chitinophagales bacterium]|nr:1-acyl-sn-glycerol-3-phosphate acyltransferase [Chitinophagales bacterium]MDW8417937.1 lysophospholipid acyltransferase family protein [Chitinophagales bacterium]
MRTRQILEQIAWLPWTLWCGLVFALVLAVAFPIMVIIVLSKNERWLYWAHFVPHYLSRFVLWMWGIRLVEHHREYAEPKRQMIFISNHTSYLDAIVASAVIPNFSKFLGKAEILKWPVLGYILKHLYVAVQRDDEEDRQRSMHEMREKLKTGASFFICPEGTCNTTREFLTYFHPGAFRLAIEHGLPLVPLTFVNTGKLFPRYGLMIRPGTVHVYWHRPIETSSMTTDDLEKLKEMSQAVMREHLLKHYPSGKYGE